jgi:hypothetical protein
MNKAQEVAVEEALADVETFLIHTSELHRKRLRTILKRLVRKAIKAEWVQV